jgi:hypothetical protein
MLPPGGSTHLLFEWNNGVGSKVLFTKREQSKFGCLVMMLTAAYLYDHQHLGATVHNLLRSRHIQVIRPLCVLLLQIHSYQLVRGFIAVRTGAVPAGCVPALVSIALIYIQ